MKAEADKTISGRSISHAARSFTPDGWQRQVTARRGLPRDTIGSSAKSFAAVMLVHVALCVFAFPASAEAADTYAVIVSGISKDPNDQAVRAQAVSGLREYLLKQMAVDPRRLTVFAADKSNTSPASSLQPTASQVAKVIETLASTIRPEDRFLFHYIGQANAAGGELRLNLPGPDVTAQDLADRLKAIKASEQLVVLDCPCAGTAVKALTAANRIIVCASTATQAYGTRFTPHFVHALAQPQTDANDDGKVSLLEAFTAAAREIEQWYRDKQILTTETPCLEDDGDGTVSERPWRYQTEGGDGAKASAFLLQGGPQR
jgi:hypothetical protein